MPSLFTEGTYEQAIIELFENMGYDHLYAPDFDRDYTSPLLDSILRDSLVRINRGLPVEAIDEALAKLKNFDTGSLLQKNIIFMDYLQNGITVKFFVKGEEQSSIVRLIDYANAKNNSFYVVNQFTFLENGNNRRPDIILFINGLPLVLMELKSPAKDEVGAENAYHQIRNYMQDIPSIFYYNAICVISDLSTNKAGTITSGLDRFMEWKTKDGNYEDTAYASFETFYEGMFPKERLLDILKNFILFSGVSNSRFKVLAGYHQYFAVRKAIEKAKVATKTDGKGGVFWHTQGSGKSYSMVFLSQKIRRKFAGSPTIVVLTDREELNTQISDTFENCGLLGKTKASKFIATSGEDLINKLKGNPSFIFTLIQKFNKKVDEPIIPDHDIIIMSDEAHRSQYGVFADNMVELLPTASRIGFTGTPLLSNDNITERTFGGYISIYDFKRAVEDKATVPLYYENRGEKILDINNPDITDKILDAIEAADLDPEQEEKLEHEFEKEIHLLTAEPRLKSVARDFVSHYSDLWTSGKAMFVCLNKVTCVRMYDFVQKYWQDDIKTLEKQIQTASQQEVQELERKLNWMKETEMAVVISQEQNEIQTFKKWNLDIKYHREKMEKRELDKEFKDKDNPLRVVFVCAMWLTGFDVKCLSCLYLDKPLKAHTLMQTIARANRVAEGKSNGLIIDYIGIVKALRKALADYTANVGGGSTDPTIDKGELIERVLETITAAAEFLDSKDFDLDDLVYAKDFAKISLLLTAANAVSDSRESKKQFMTYGNELNRMMKYLDRDDISKADRERKDAIIAIVDELKKKKKHVDNTDLMVQINGILGDYIMIERAANDRGFAKRFDISKIDFDLLRREFAKVKKKNLAFMDLDELIQVRLDAMIRENPRRVDYYIRYQQIIEEYNSEQDRVNIEKTFMELMDLANSMNEEEQRYVREGFGSDEELSMYDMLFDENLSKEDIKKIKKVAVDLLDKIKTKISELDHWTDKQETKAEVDNLIGKILWEELPESYSDSAIFEYRKLIFEYVFMRYKQVA